MKLLAAAICVAGLSSACLAIAADSPRVAAIWHAGNQYQSGDYVTYDGALYKALAGASHRHPDPNLEEGWRKMYDCDEDASHPVRCEKGKGSVVPMGEVTDENYKTVQDHMTMGAAPGVKK